MIGNLAGATALILLAGCAAAGADRPERTDACLMTGARQIPVSLELAKTPDQRSQGLMGRASLPESSGMLFIYNRPRKPDYGFWMYQTLIPLDIAYLDENGEIASIRQMAPCPSKRGSDCPSYPAGVSFSLALEMNQGFFQAHGVDVGDRLELDAGACHGSA